MSTEPNTPMRDPADLPAAIVACANALDQAAKECLDKGRVPVRLALHSESPGSRERAKLRLDLDLLFASAVSRLSDQHRIVLEAYEVKAVTYDFPESPVWFSTRHDLRMSAESGTSLLRLAYMVGVVELHATALASGDPYLYERTGAQVLLDEGSGRSVQQLVLHSSLTNLKYVVSRPAEVYDWLGAELSKQLHQQFAARRAQATRPGLVNTRRAVRQLVQTIALACNQLDELGANVPLTTTTGWRNGEEADILTVDVRKLIDDYANESDLEFDAAHWLAQRMVRQVRLVNTSSVTGVDDTVGVEIVLDDGGDGLTILEPLSSFAITADMLGGVAVLDDDPSLFEPPTEDGWCYASCEGYNYEILREDLTTAGLTVE